MEYEVEFRDGDGPVDVEITRSGAPTSEGFQLLNERLVSDPHFRAGLTLLVDVGALDTSALSDETMQFLSGAVVERDWFFAPAVVAIIAPDEETFNAARAYRAHIGGSKSNRHLFRSRAEAVAWLEST